MVITKKSKAIPLTGLLGNATDYNVYKLSPLEVVIGYIAVSAGSFLVIQIMFHSLWASLFVSLALGFAGIPLANKILLNRRRKNLLLQFKDMLESLSTSIGVGKNIVYAFEDAQQDMLNQYGDKSHIYEELTIILDGLRNNLVIEDLLHDFAARSGLEDIRSFADVFEICNRQGGNMKQVIYETKNIISEKIEIEMEINTMVSGKKNELNIMSIMPLVIILMLQGFGGDGGFNQMTITNIVVRAIALVAFVIAYAIGLRIVNIRV